MSFASNARGELARESCGQICCARSELAGALLSSGGISFRGLKRYALSLTSSDGAIVRRYFSLLKQFWGVTAQIRTLSADTLNGSVRYQLVIPEEHSLTLMGEMRLLDDGALFGVRTVPDAELTKLSCCKKSFLRGAFLMCGAVSNPEREYHIEIAASNVEFAQFIVEIMNDFEIFAKIACRKAKYVVYLKKAEEISDWLTLMGAGAAVLSLENVRIRKDVSNQVNRQMNCDSSNINRTMAAAESRIEDIRFLDREIGLDKLPKALRETAEARLNNPDVSLTELGELLVPPLGKSGVNTRLRRLGELANRLRAGEETGLSSK